MRTNHLEWQWLCLALTLLCAPAFAQNCGAYAFDDFMGVNNFILKAPSEKAAPFGIVRDYVLWGATQGANNTAYDPDNPPVYHFAPIDDGISSYDRHFQKYDDVGCEILADLKCAPPYLLTYQYNGHPADKTLADFVAEGQVGAYGSDYFKLLERIPMREPGSWSGLQLSPKLFFEQSDRLFQIVARYGNNVFGPDYVRSTDHVSGLGLLDFVENWNEPDKDWINPMVSFAQELLEKDLANLTPHEYAVMSTADNNWDYAALPPPYDALFPSDHNPGSANADGTVGRVMAGLSDITDLKHDYLTDLINEFPSGTFPFGVINAHHYSVQQDGNGGWIGHGIPPEEDTDFPILSQFVSTADQLGAEFWLTEFGYSTHPAELTAAIPAYNNYDIYEVQGQWIVRTYLMLAGYGVDRAFCFQLSDPLDGSGRFGFCGLMSDYPNYAPKTSWFYAYTMRNVLQGLHFATSLIDAGTYPVLSPAQEPDQQPNPVHVYRFEDNCGAPSKTVYAVWFGTDDNNQTCATCPKQSYTLQVGTGQPVDLVEMVAGNISGNITPLTPNANGFVTFDISERPVFVRVGDSPPLPGCACGLPLTPSMVTPSSAATLVDEQALVGDPRCGTGNPMNSHWMPGNAGLATINLGELYHITSFYLHDPIWWENGTVTVQFFDENNQPVMQNGQPVTFVYSPNDPGFSGQPRWKHYENLDFNAQFVKITMSEPTAIISEIVICGEPVELDVVPPAPVPGMESVGGSCDAIEWVMRTTGDDGMVGSPALYRVYYTTDVNNFPNNLDNVEYMEMAAPQIPSNTVLYFIVSGLQEGTTYYFGVIAIDEAGNESTFYLYNGAASTISDCYEPCDCQLLSLNPSMFWDYNPLTGQGGLNPASGPGQAGSLADEQELSGNPFCGEESGDPSIQWTLPWTNGPSYAYVDLGETKDISSIALYDGPGGGRLKIHSGTPGLPPNGGFNDLVIDYDGGLYPYDWVVFNYLNEFPLSLSTRYLLFTKTGPDSKYNEVMICANGRGRKSAQGEKVAPRPICQMQETMESIFFPIQQATN